jgi:hypothetical protein
VQGVARELAPPQFTLLGITVLTDSRTTYPGLGEGNGAETFFSRANGRQVQVRGSLDGSIVIADQVRLVGREDDCSDPARNFEPRLPRKRSDARCRTRLRLRSDSWRPTCSTGHASGVNRWIRGGGAGGALSRVGVRRRTTPLCETPDFARHRKGCKNRTP